MRLIAPLSAVLAVLLLVPQVRAEDPATETPPAIEPGERPGRPPLTPEMKEKLLAEFDKDGDGTLNEEEKGAMQEALAKRRAEQRRPPLDPERKAKMLAEFDKDGDGTLSDDEKAAMKEAMAKRRAEKEPSDSPRRRPTRAEILEKFDANGDGKLTGEERENARAAQKAREGADLPKGEAAQQTRGNARPQGGRVGGNGPGLNDQNKARILQQFDADGNGRLEGQEMEQARQAAAQFQMQQRQNGGRAFGPNGQGRPGGGGMKAGPGGPGGGGGGGGPKGGGGGPRR